MQSSDDSISPPPLTAERIFLCHRGRRRERTAHDHPPLRHPTCDSTRLRCNHPTLCCNTPTHEGLGIAHAYFCHPTSPINWGGLTSASYNEKHRCDRRRRIVHIRLLKMHPTHVDSSSSAKYEPRYGPLRVVPQWALSSALCPQKLNSSRARV